MCENQNIKVAEGNDFTLILPLKARTYSIDGRPSDRDLEVQNLTDVVLKIGGVSYECSVVELGVSVFVAGTLPVGTYDVVLTGKYFDSNIRAAYFSLLTVVSWNYQSDAEQYLPGSPIVAGAVVLIGGALDDADIDALKAELRQAIADNRAAQAEAEAAKQAYIEKAEQLEDFAKETTSQQILSGVGSAAQQGTDASATNTAIYNLVRQEGIERANEYAAEIHEIIGYWNY